MSTSRRKLSACLVGRRRWALTGCILALLLLSVVTQLAFASPARAEDTTAPELTAFSLAPDTINTESADQTLTVTVTMSDAESGIASSSCAEVHLAPLIGTQSAYFPLTRVSGDEHSGVYSGTAVLPRGSKEGIWNVTGFYAHDQLGNFVSLDGSALNARLPGAEGLVVANTALAQQVAIERDWTISSASSSATFPAGTLVTRADDGRFAFYQMLAQEFALDDSIPSADLDGTPLATLKLGIPGLNLAFSQPVTISMEVGTAYNGYRLSIQSLTEDGVAWASETTCAVANGRVLFTVNHATRFVANLVKSSVPRPAITKLSSTSGKRGTIITITGRNFGKRGTASAVKFGATKCAKYISWSATRIKCKVPAKAKFGRHQVKVTTAAGISNGRNYTVKR